MSEGSHIELPPSDEELLHQLAPSDTSGDEGDGFHKRVIPGEPSSYEDALAELVQSDRGGSTTAEKRREDLSLESKALYQNVQKMYHEVGQRALRQTGSEALVQSANEAHEAWNNFRDAFLDYETEKIDEEQLFLIMRSTLTTLERVRDSFLPEQLDA